MGLTKYKGFQIGDDMPPENINSIDPDNPIANPTVSQLIGGSNPSALSVFLSLANSDNNGKIKINIYGNVYDDIAVNLLSYSGTSLSLYSGQGAGSQSERYLSPTTTGKIASFSFLAYSYGATVKIEIRENNVLLATSDSFYQGSGNYTLTASFLGANQITLLAGHTYYFKIVTVSGDHIVYTSTYGGQYQLSVSGYVVDVTYQSIASNVQAAIRTATGGTETVVYSTDHFVITGAKAGQYQNILKLLSPSSGIDISGNATEKYLDLGVDATEVAGTGDDYNLVRLGGDGKIIDANLPSETSIISTGEIVLANAPSERTTSSNAYSKLKEITVNKAGTYNVRFMMKNTTYISYGRIYVNDVAIGAEHSLNDNKGIYYLYSDNITVNAGDKIQLYFKNSISGSTGSIKDFQVLLKPTIDNFQVSQD